MKFAKLSHQILFGFVAVVVLTLGISGWGIVSLTQRIIAGNIARQHQMLADRVAEEIELRNQDVEPILSNLADSAQVRSMDPVVVAAELHRYQALFSMITRIYVADMSGQQIARTDGQPLENVVTTLGFQAARQGRELVSDVCFARDGTEPILTVYEPVMGDGQVIGVLVADINFAWVQTILENLTLIRNETAVVLAQNGRVVAHNRMAELDEPPVLTDPALIRTLVQDPAGVLKGYTDELGRIVVGSHAPVGELGWGVVIQSPVEELAAETAVLYRTIVLGLLGGTILIVAAGWLMERADAELRGSEAWYRGLFEDSPTSLWEEDFSGAKNCLDDLRDVGVTDFRAYLVNHPEALRSCAAVVRIIDVNRATLELLRYESKDELVGKLVQILREESYDVFREELISLAEGNRTYRAEVSNYTRDGNKIYVSLGLTVMPGYEDTWSRVLISLTDITERVQAEEALRKSETRLAEAQRIAYLGSWDWNIETNDLYWSDEIYRIFSLSPKEFGATYEAFLNFIHPDDLELVQRSVDEALYEHKPYDIDHRVVLLDGSKRVVHGRAEVVFDETDEPIRMVGTIQDITARVRVEEALRGSEKRYRALFEEAPVMYLIVRDEQGTPVIFDCNASFLTTLGYTRDQVVGRPLAGFFTPESQAALLQGGGFQRALKGEMKTPVERHLVACDGRIIATVLRAVPEVGESGQVIGTRAMFTDITEQARLHDQVRRNAAELEQRVAQATAEIRRRADELMALYDVSRDLVATLDLQTLLPAIAQRVTDTLKADRCAVFMFDPRTDMLWARASHGYMAERLTGFGYRAGEEIAGQAYARRESQYVPDLDLVPGLPKRDAIRAVLAVPLVSPSAGPLGTLSVASLQPDAFTSDQQRLLETMASQIAAAVEHARLYEAAQEADRVKSAFLAAMSHELRTPLNSIIGFTGILLQGLTGPLSAEQAKQLGMVQNSARHLLNLINDVLDISKIEAGQLEVASEPFDMREVIEKVMQTVTPLAEKKRIAMAAEVAPEVGRIVSDRRRVEQILINLVNNGIKFTEQGEVRVECRVGGGQLITRVMDTGIGIKPEDMDILFEPFRQIDTGLARKREGTGLGLSICKRLVEMLGGEIGVESEWGVGSAFTFTLPLQAKKEGNDETQDPRHRG